METAFEHKLRVAAERDRSMQGKRYMFLNVTGKHNDIPTMTILTVNLWCSQQPSMRLPDGTVRWIDMADLLAITNYMEV